MKKKELLSAYIDTTRQETIFIRIRTENQSKEKEVKVKHLRSQMVLPVLVGFLSDLGKKLTDLTELEVNTGPGSFTGIRVGLSVVNALGWLLGIPVNGKETIAEPTYTPYNDGGAADPKGVI